MFAKFSILFLPLGFNCLFSISISNLKNGKQETDTLAVKSNATIENIKKGKKLFEQNCIMCHGALGKGDGAAGIYLNPRPFDISSEKVQLQNDFLHMKFYIHHLLYFL